MQASILKMYNRLLDGWRNLDKGKKIRLVATAIILVLALSVTLYFVFKPRMVVLDRSNDLQTLSSMKRVLDDNGITNRISENTSAIEVREQDKDRAKLLMAENGYSNPGITYSDAFDMMDMTMTESVKRDVMMAQKQDELGRLLETIDAIDTAKVTIAAPSDGSVMIENYKVTTASVVLGLNRDLSRNTVEAIANVVSKSVENLDVKNITIMTTNGDYLYSDAEDSIAGSISTQYEQETRHRKEVEEKVRNILQPTFDDIRVAANLVLDWDDEVKNDITYVPVSDDTNTGIVSHEVLQSSEAKNQAVDGLAPGTDANNNETPGYMIGGSGESSGSQNSTERDYAVSQQQTQSKKGVGTVLYGNSSITVNLFNERTYDQAELRAAELIVDAQGNGVSWKTFQENVKSNLTQIATPEELDEFRQSITAATGIENVSITAYETPVFIDEVRVTRPFDQLLIAALLLILIGLLAFALIRRTQPDEITEIEPELSVEELLVSGDTGVLALEEPVPEIDYTVDSELKRQIDKFIDDKPEAAAQLLRNWLSDDWE